MHIQRQKEQDLQLEEDDEWLDEALRESFPASDPIPLFHRDPQTRQRSDGDPQKPTDAALAED